MCFACFVVWLLLVRLFAIRLFAAPVLTLSCHRSSRLCRPMSGKAPPFRRRTKYHRRLRLPVEARPRRIDGSPTVSHRLTAHRAAQPQEAVVAPEEERYVCRNKNSYGAASAGWPNPTNIWLLRSQETKPVCAALAQDQHLRRPGISRMCDTVRRIDL